MTRRVQVALGVAVGLLLVAAVAVLALPAPSEDDPVYVAADPVVLVDPDDGDGGFDVGRADACAVLDGADLDRLLGAGTGTTGDRTSCTARGADATVGLRVHALEPAAFYALLAAVGDEEGAVYPEPVEVSGAEAYWMWDVETGALYVRDGGSVIEVTVASLALAGDEMFDLASSIAAEVLTTG